MTDDRSPSDEGAATAASQRTGPPGGTGATTVDGVRIAYRRAGTDGPPIVFLHGGGIDDATLSWGLAIEALADEYRVYAPDWPGYGDSGDLDAGAHGTATYARVLEGFLDSAGLERATIAGISMGGAAALGFALENPDRVDRLVLVDSYGLGTRIPAGSLWRAFAHVPGANSLGWATLGLSNEAARIGLGNVVADPGGLSSAFVEGVRSRASRPGAGGAFEAFQRNEIAADGSARTDFADRLSGLSVPTLLVHGREDPLFPVEWSVRAADRLPDARLEVLEECGHWGPRERPDRFHEVLRGFLSATGP